MCISNTTLRRTYNVPMIPAAAARINNDSSVLPRVAVKNEFNRQNVGMNAFKPNPFPMSAPSSAPPQPKTHGGHIIVQHNYHDHSNDSRANYQEEHPARGGVTTPFPLKLHEMLDAVARDNMESIVSWQPHGRCFVVHKPKEFVELLPTYFKLSKLASFQRQLNLYGFQRLTRGRDRGGYYHELFLKGREFLAHNIQRIKVKGTGVRARSNPEQEPDFWAMSWVSTNAHVDSDSDSSSVPAAQPEELLSLNGSVEKSIATLPLQLNIPVPLQAPTSWTDLEEDLISAFGDKTFHYLDPFQNTHGQEKPKWSVQGVDDLLTSEAESFFEDFDFPEDIGNEIENDDVFGDMLEQMIA